MSATLENSWADSYKVTYSSPLNNVGLNCTGPLNTHSFFNQYTGKKCWTLVTIYKNIFFSLVYCIIRILYNIIYNVTIYKVCINQLFTLSVRLFIVKFLGSQKLYADFQLHGGLSTPNLCTVEGSTVYTFHQPSNPTLWFLPKRNENLGSN